MKSILFTLYFYELAVSLGERCILSSTVSSCSPGSYCAREINSYKYPNLIQDVFNIKSHETLGICVVKCENSLYDSCNPQYSLLRAVTDDLLKIKDEIAAKLYKSKFNLYSHVPQVMKVIQIYLYHESLFVRQNPNEEKKFKQKLSMVSLNAALEEADSIRDEKMTVEAWPEFYQPDKEIFPINSTYFWERFLESKEGDWQDKFLVLNPLELSVDEGLLMRFTAQKYIEQNSMRLLNPFSDEELSEEFMNKSDENNKEKEEQKKNDRSELEPEMTAESLESSIEKDGLKMNFLFRHKLPYILRYIQVMELAYSSSYFEDPETLNEEWGFLMERFIMMPESKSQDYTSLKTFIEHFKVLKDYFSTNLRLYHWFLKVGFIKLQTRVFLFDYFTANAGLLVGEIKKILEDPKTFWLEKTHNLYYRLRASASADTEFLTELKRLLDAGEELYGTEKIVLRQEFHKEKFKRIINFFKDDFYSKKKIFIDYMMTVFKHRRQEIDFDYEEKYYKLADLDAEKEGDNAGVCLPGVFHKEGDFQSRSVSNFCYHKALIHRRKVDWRTRRIELLEFAKKKFDFSRAVKPEDQSDLIKMGDNVGKKITELKNVVEQNPLSPAIKIEINDFGKMGDTQEGHSAKKVPISPKPIIQNSMQVINKEFIGGGGL